METLSESEISRIKTSIQDIKSKTDSLKRVLSQKNYSYDLSKAHDSLQQYTNAQSSCLKNARSSIDRAIKGFSSSGSADISKAVECKASESYQKARQITEDLARKTGKLIDSLPRIGTTK